MSIQTLRETRIEVGDHPHLTQKKILQKMLNGNVWDHDDMHHFTEHLVQSFPHDAFFRLRVATPTTLFDSALDIAARTDIWDYSGTFVHNATRSTGTLSVPAALANTTRQTKRSFHYQPGKSQFGIFSFCFGPRQTGITRRVGLFNGQDGLFFEQTSTGIRFVERSSSTGITVDHQFDQGSWNRDKLDGTGPSGFTLNDAWAQIFFVQFEWLGVGPAEFGFIIDGVPVVCHDASHFNELDAPYMATANLPVRYQIDNDGTGPAASMEQICCTVISEGGVQLNGPLIGIDRAATPLITLNDADLYPLLALRLGPQAADLRGNLYINDISVMCASTAVFRWALLLNPTVAGAALNWVNSGQISQIATDAVNTTKVSGGLLVASGYGQTTIQTNILAERALPDDALLGCSLAGVRDFAVLAIQRITGTTETFYATLNYREQL